MEEQLIPIGITVAGLIFLTRNIVMYLNSEKLEEYVNTSPKAKLWVSKFGKEKTIQLSKTIFLPIGCMVSIAFILIGARSLLIVNGIM